MDESNSDIKNISKEFSFNVITHTIQLEDVMTTIICLELSKDWLKMENFVDYFDRTGFDYKIKLVETILKTNHPHILQKFPDIFSEIKEIKNLRNNLAHKDRFYLASVNGSEVKFALHNKKNTLLEFTESEMVLQMKNIEKCLKDMWKIQDLFAKDFGYSSII